MWHLRDILKECDELKYLGVILSHRKPHVHLSGRCSGCRKVYYALQGAGLCNLETNVDTTPYVRIVKIDKTRMNELEPMQGKLIKAMFGLHKH